MPENQSYDDVCPKAVTGEHWWLRLIRGGRRCYLCGKVEDAR